MPAKGRGSGGALRHATGTHARQSRPQESQAPSTAPPARKRTRRPQDEARAGAAGPQPPSRRTVGHELRRIEIGEVVPHNAPVLQHV